MKDISYWLDEEYVPRKPLKGEVDADVVIIGGGITGVSAAYHCAKFGLKTVLLEQNQIASGAAGMNGGMIVEGLSCDFMEAVEAFGAAEAEAIWKMTSEAQKLTLSLIAENKIDCDLTPGGSVYVGTRDEDDEWLKKEVAARSEKGITSAFYEKGDQLTKSPFNGYLFNERDARLNPVRFVRGLAKVAESLGAKIFEGSQATAYDRSSVATSGGRISARSVVLAMESSTPGALSLCQLIPSFGAMTEPLSDETWKKFDWPKGVMLWTSGKNYACFCKVGNRLFINGDGDMHDLMSECFPAVNKKEVTLSHLWKGPILYPNDDRPHIDQRDGVYRVFGQGGNGLTNAVITGKIVAGILKGEPIPAVYSKI